MGFLTSFMKMALESFLLQDLGMVERLLHLERITRISQISTLPFLINLEWTKLSFIQFQEADLRYTILQKNTRIDAIAYYQSAQFLEI